MSQHNSSVLNCSNRTITGNSNVINGDNNTVRGNYNVINGDNNTAHGVGNIMNGRYNNEISCGTTGNFAVHNSGTQTVNYCADGIAGNNYGGVQIMSRAGDVTTTRVSSGGFAGENHGVRIQVNRGIGVQGVDREGCTFVNNFSDDAVTTTIIDKVTPRERPVAAAPAPAEASRDRDPPAKKITYPEPWAEEPGYGIEGLKKCINCKKRSAVVIAIPCAHTSLCVDCCLAMKPIACVKCKKDVSEFKMVPHDD